VNQLPALLSAVRDLENGCRVNEAARLKAEAERDELRAAIANREVRHAEALANALTDGFAAGRVKGGREAVEAAARICTEAVDGLNIGSGGEDKALCCGYMASGIACQIRALLPEVQS
jgi:hypothetical protein